MIPINLKSIECKCGAIFTAPKQINNISDEFKELGIPYKEGVLKSNSSWSVLYCPDCDREAYRVRL